MNLDELRKNIDKVDEEIIKLLNERYDLVRQVGEWKHSNYSSFYVPEREKILLERLKNLNNGLLPDKALKAIYREILSGALFLEKDLKIAFLGPNNTFSHQAAKNKFGECLTYVAKSSIAAVFEAVSTEEVQYAVVPVENSIEGAVNHTLDLLVKATCKICSELRIYPEQCLMSKGKIENIKTIYSHSQAIGQCRQWLYQHFPNVELIEVDSTAEGAKLASEKSFSGAIASELSAQEFELIIHYKNIEDSKNNTTRFLILGNQDTKPSGFDKTSLMFALNDRVGALRACLQCFSNYGINLTMIESRPCREMQGKHLFFVDFQGHQSDENINQVLEELYTHTVSLKVLGSYPEA